MGTQYANYDDWKTAYPDSWDDEEIFHPDFVCPKCKGESEVCKDVCDSCYSEQVNERERLK